MKLNPSQKRLAYFLLISCISYRFYAQRNKKSSYFTLEGFTCSSGRRLVQPIFALGKADRESQHDMARWRYNLQFPLKCEMRAPREIIISRKM